MRRRKRRRGRLRSTGLVRKYPTCFSERHTKVVLSVMIWFYSCEPRPVGVKRFVKSVFRSEPKKKTAGERECRKLSLLRGRIRWALKVKFFNTVRVNVNLADLTKTGLEWIWIFIYPQASGGPGISKRKFFQKRKSGEMRHAEIMLLKPVYAHYPFGKPLFEAEVISVFSELSCLYSNYWIGKTKISDMF